MIRFQDVRVIGNTGKNSGLFHVTKNAYFEGKDCLFIENRAFGRGVVVFAEQKESLAAFINSTFIRNHGMYGGLFYSDTNGKISSLNSTFSENFAFQGGIGF